MQFALPGLSWITPCTLVVEVAPPQQQQLGFPFTKLRPLEAGQLAPVRCASATWTMLCLLTRMLACFLLPLCTQQLHQRSFSIHNYLFYYGRDGSKLINGMLMY